MPTSAEPDTLLLDTSAAIALVSPGHVGHRVVRERVSGHRLGLSGHAVWETLSVLTRLPAPMRVTPAAAVRLIDHNFPATVHPRPPALTALLPELVRSGVAGGAVYDALVAAAARDHDLLLLSRDLRAAETYRLLGVRLELLG